MSIDWDDVGNWGGIIGYSLMLIGVILYMVFLVGSCMSTKDPQIDANAWTEPASVCDYKLALIWRGQFRPGEEGEKDFYNSVTAQVEWLWKHNYTVFRLKYEYGFDVTHNLILRCAVIFYKEVKNGIKKKEGD